MSYNKGLVATLAELEQWYKGQRDGIGDTLELMNQTNDILSDISFMEANQSDGHKTRIRTGLPEVYWRRLYKGTPPSKSQWAQVKEATSMMEARMELDRKECELYGDKAAAFRLSESKAFTEAMRQKVATTLFYGNSAKNPDEFNGFAMRYPSKTSPNVIDAGGTGNACTSIYLIAWGADTCHGIYPNGSKAGLSHRDLGEETVQDGDGNKFRAMVDLYDWDLGLAVRDWRSVVRIANIDTTKLSLKAGDTGYIDLQKFTIQAKNKMPATMRNRAIWYMNDEVLTALELQSIDRNGVHLTYGEYFDSKAVAHLHGRPIRQVDALVCTEKAI